MLSDRAKFLCILLIIWGPTVTIPDSQDLLIKKKDREGIFMICIKMNKSLQNQYMIMLCL